MVLLRFLTAILSFGDKHSRRTAELVVNHSQRFYESLRSIDTPCRFLGRPLTQKKGKLENRRLSCQSFTEIIQISEKVWYETPCRNSLKLKTRSSSYSGLNKSIQVKKIIKIPCNSPLKYGIECSATIKPMTTWPLNKLPTPAPPRFLCNVPKKRCSMYE